MFASKILAGLDAHETEKDLDLKAHKNARMDLVCTGAAIYKVHPNLCIYSH